jgi:hypothetical protein
MRKRANAWRAIWPISSRSCAENRAVVGKASTSKLSLTAFHSGDSADFYSKIVFEEDSSWPSFVISPFSRINPINSLTFKNEFSK